jgi:hypothetical protein
MNYLIIMSKKKQILPVVQIYRPRDIFNFPSQLNYTNLLSLSKCYMVF